MTQWIRDRSLSRAPWAAYPGLLGTDISGALDRPTYNLQKRCWNSYQTWNYDYDARPEGPLPRQRLAVFADAVGRSYLLTDAPIEVGPEVGIRLESRFTGTMLSQRLYVYRLDPTSRAARALPNCR